MDAVTIVWGYVLWSDITYGYFPRKPKHLHAWKISTLCVEFGIAS